MEIFVKKIDNKILTVPIYIKFPYMSWSTIPH